MTILVVALLRGRTKAEWYDWVADRVSRGIGYNTPASIPDPYRQAQKGGIAPAGRGRGRGVAAAVAGGAGRGGPPQQGGLSGLLANAVSGGGLVLNTFSESEGTTEDNATPGLAGGRAATEESDDEVRST